MDKLQETAKSVLLGEKQEIDESKFDNKMARTKASLGMRNVASAVMKVEPFIKKLGDKALSKDFDDLDKQVEEIYQALENMRNAEVNQEPQKSLVTRRRPGSKPRW